MEKINDILKNNMRQYAMLIALVAIMAFFQIATKGILLVPMNVTNLVLQNSYVLILAIGMTLCILSGGNIDLSVGSVCAFVGAILGTFIYVMKWDVTVSIIIALIVGGIIGAWQGFWIAYIRIPSFIVTLSGYLAFRGLTISMLKGLTLSPFPESFQQISGGFIPDAFKSLGLKFDLTTLIVGVAASILYVVLQFRKRSETKKYAFEMTPIPLFIIQILVVLAAINLFSYWLSAYKGIPIIFIILGILVFVYSLFTTKTVPGRYIYAMGGNEKAAKLSGINTNKVLFYTYVNMGVLAAAAGVCFTSRLNAASPQAGIGFELDAIAACFIGGASAYGGIGTVIGGVIGALVMGVLNNGMSILGMDSAIQQTIKGFVLLMAVAFDVFSKMKSK